MNVRESYCKKISEDDLATDDRKMGYMMMLAMSGNIQSE
jgi:hypothetical protein